MRRRRRRNLLRGAERRAFYRAWRLGERYCSTCACYRSPHRFTGADPRTCDHCRGLHHCPRCQHDQPAGEFGDGTTIAADDTCRTCRSYRPLAEQERVTLETFLAANLPSKSAGPDDGVTLGRDRAGRPLRLRAQERHRHLYIIGKPGTGKTALMRNLVVQDMVAGHGCAVLDVAGDLAVELLGCVPEPRLPAVTYFAPASGHGPTFNPLALPYPAPVLADTLVEMFKPFFADRWEPQLAHLLRFGLLTLLGDRAPHTLADLYTFYVAPGYRATLAESSPSPRLRAFWQYEFPTIDPGALRHIAGKLAEFLTPLSPLERLFSIPESTLSLEELIVGRQIFIANLSREALGAEPSRLLAGLLIHALAHAARSCAERRGRDGPHFMLYLPEFQDHAAWDFDTLLPELAKNGISLTCAHQRRVEPNDCFPAALMTAMGTIAAFQVDAADAAQMQAEMRTRRVTRATTGALYEHEEVRRAAVEPVVARARKLLADARTFAGDDEPNYQGSRIDAVLADIERVRHIPPPADLVEIDWPRPTDFTSLEPRSALVRIDRPDTVTALIVDSLPPPDPQVRAKILERPRRREPARGHGEAGPAATGSHPGRSNLQAPTRKRWRGAIRTLRRRAR